MEDINKLIEEVTKDVQSRQKIIVKENLQLAEKLLFLHDHCLHIFANKVRWLKSICSRFCWSIYNAFAGDYDVAAFILRAVLEGIKNNTYHYFPPYLKDVEKKYFEVYRSLSAYVHGERSVSSFEEYFDLARKTIDVAIAIIVKKYPLPFEEEELGDFLFHVKDLNLELNRKMWLGGEDLEK